MMTRPAKLLLASAVLALTAASASAMSFTRYSSSEKDGFWAKSEVQAVDAEMPLPTSSTSLPCFRIDAGDRAGSSAIVTFKGWGTCFNELGWDALQVLPEEKREELLKRIFAPDGDLKYTHGRIPLGANDYARSWYSASEVPGDFELRHFNMTRDLSTIIPFIHAAQKYNPQLWFWCSPWSPPAWMKINQDYPVMSSRFNKMDSRIDYLLHMDPDIQPDSDKFPDLLTSQDYMIMDPRYLKAYADYFCRCIEAFGLSGIPIKRVMYQNEAYSYPPYPGCPWTPKGAALFNAEYLAPALKEKHPDVELYLGTINTDRFEEVDSILSDAHVIGKDLFQGIGFQWEGSRIISDVRQKYPFLKVVQTESECGCGSFDWRGALHTFAIINDYLGKGCEEYTFWNVILCDDGKSSWGWKQNALIRVDSKEKTAEFTPEYYAVMHYSHFVSAGTMLVNAFHGRIGEAPTAIFITPEGKYVVVTANRDDKVEAVLSIKFGAERLDVVLPPNSMHTFVED